MRDDGWGLAHRNHRASTVVHYFRDMMSLCGKVRDGDNRINMDVWLLGVCKICQKIRTSEVNPE